MNNSKLTAQKVRALETSIAAARTPRDCEGLKLILRATGLPPFVHMRLLASVEASERALRAMPVAA